MCYDPKEIFIAVLYAFEAVVLTAFVVTALTKSNNSNINDDLNVNVEIGKTSKKSRRI